MKTLAVPHAHSRASDLLTLAKVRVNALAWPRNTPSSVIVFAAVSSSAWFQLAAE
jgi:hypothetical protein